jgi:hypothetical protein
VLHLTREPQARTRETHDRSRPTFRDASCNILDSGPTLGGSVSYIYATPPGTQYPGEIRVEGTTVGAVRVYISYGMPIHLRSSKKSGDFSSFALGGRVIMHYDEDGVFLESDPPVWPVTDIEIEK